MQSHPLLEQLAGLPPILTYLVLGAGAAIENIVPPVPADTFVLLGAFLATAGRISAPIVFVVTWIANVGSALLVFRMARKWGPGMFDRPAGRWLLRPRQLDRIGVFYRRWGTSAILVSRFLPGFRAVVPVFAGISHLSIPRVAVPMAIASAVWYGGLVALGSFAGRNFDRIMAVFGDASRILLVFTVVAAVAIGYWWWRTRHEKG